MNDVLKVISDLRLLLLPAASTIREGLKRLNAAPQVFQVIIDENGRILGALTDGDVRRALLAGVGMDDPVTLAMQPKPLTGASTDLADARRKLATIKSIVPFIPLIDAERRVVAVLVRGAQGASLSTALIMAGGRGTRLGEQTRSVPKPLLTVNGKPMIEYVVAAVEAAGGQDIFVSVHYLADQIEQWCADRKGAARLQVLREKQPLGTAGALALLPGDIDGNILVSNADLVTQVDLSAFADFHDHLQTDATIAVARYEVDIPFGVVRADEEGRFLEIQEKPRMTHFVSAGIYILGPEVRSLVRPGVRLDMPELLDLARRAGLKIGVFPIHEPWRDVGRPSDLKAANSGDAT